MVVGHWPVTLYHSHIPSAAPIILRHRKIISIDGGCALKADGQLNALILPSEESSGLYLDILGRTAHRHRLINRNSLSGLFEHPLGRSALELLEEGRHLPLPTLGKRRILSILNQYLRRSPSGLWCEDSTDYRLPVSPGDRLTLVAAATRLCKKEGVSGWYYGRLSDIMEGA